MTNRVKNLKGRKDIQLHLPDCKGVRERIFKVGFKSVSATVACLFLLLMCPFAVSAQAPVAGFTSDIISGCKPILVKFTDQSANGPTKWTWDLGNGTISHAQNPVTTYVEAGKYEVKLIAANAAGSDTIIKTAFITVFDLPQVDFFSNDTIGCAPLASQFTDISAGTSGAITQWEWAFGDGGTSNAQNPLHNFATAGTYNVSLKAINSSGCSNVAFKPQYIRVGNPIVADFTSAISPYCSLPVKVFFSNLSTSADSLSYTWDFGDATTTATASPDHDFTSFGSFNIMLTARGAAGCTDTVSRIVNVKQQAVDFSSPASICTGVEADFAINADPPPLFVTWKMGDGAVFTIPEVSYAYAVPGVYTVTLISDFGGCIDSTSKDITVTNGQGTDFFTKDTAACLAPYTVNFSNSSSSVVSRTWDFGDLGTSGARNPVHIYKAAGSYDVTLQVVDSSGCISKITKPAYVKIIAPVIRFLNVPVSGCAPFSFTPSYTINHAEPVISYSWSFGDGSTSADTFPVHTYTLPGIYTLSLIVETAGGCRDTLTVANGIKVSEKGNNNVDFSIDTSFVCVHQQVSFTSIASGQFLAYSWSFGDNVFSGVPNPVHSYIDTGTYTVKLDVSFGGCITSVVKPALIKVMGPVSAFTFVKDCVNRGEVTFTNTSENSLSSLWLFGDGNTSDEFNPVHLYADTGTYNVRLISENGCTDTSKKLIPVWLDNISISAASADVCKGQPVTFTVVHPRPEYVASYNFNFTGNLSDGFISTSTATVGWVYKTAGNYKVTVFTVDKFGCRDTAVLSTLINVHGPVAKFGVVKNFQCAGQLTEFVDQSVSDGAAAITGWRWYFGDSTTQDYTSPPFDHVYAKPGRFSVGLKVTDAFGCTDSITQRGFITAYLAAADFNSLDSFGCPGRPVRFTDRSAGAVFGRIWDFGDGATSTDANPSHVYAAIGTYTVKLTIFSAGGCVDSITKTNYISLGYPKAAFSLSDSVSSCPPLQVNFSDSSQYAASYLWSLGDGSVSSIKNPAANYFLPGNYKVRLTVTSPGGCKDSAFASIAIAGPNGVIAYSPLSGCKPVPVKLSIKTTGAIYFTWDYGDGFTSESPDSSSAHTYASGGKFLPRVLIKNVLGCTVPIISKDTVFIEDLVAKFGVGKTVTCDTASVSFVDSSTAIGNLSYKWSFGDGSTSALQNPSHSYAAAGKYPVRLIVNSSIGCADTSTYAGLIEVYNLPSVSIIADPTACEGSVAFTSQVVPDPQAPVTDFIWRFGNGDSSILPNPLPEVFSAGNYTNFLTVTNSKGCLDTVSKQLIIDPLPVLLLSSDTAICQSDSIQLNITGAVSYLWTGTTATISCTTCDNPVIYPVVNTTYAVIGKSSAGCQASDSVQVQVLAPFTLKAVASYDLCAGTSVQLTTSGAPLYLWTPDTGLSSNNVSNPFATPAATTLYTVTGYDSQGCFTDTASISVTVYSQPTVELGNDITTSAGNTMVLTPVVSNNVSAYKWTPADNLSCSTCATPGLTASDNTTYHLLVTTDQGCYAEDTLRIIVTCGNSEVFVPNTFSPNGDGSNDVFYIRAKGIASVHAFRVLNRYGETVFQKRYVTPNDTSFGWDGTFKNQQAETGVYVYYVEVVCTNNQVLKYSGNVTLIR